MPNYPTQPFKVRLRHTRLAIGISLCSLLLAALSLLNLPEAALAQAEPTPRPLYALPDARTNLVFTGSSLAFDSNSRLLFTANMMSDTVSIVAPVAGEVRGEVPVGDDPRSVAVTADGTRVLVTNRGDATLSIVDPTEQAATTEIALGGLWPYSVVTSSNTVAYVAMQGSREIAVVDLAAGDVQARIPTPAYPTGLALWGDFLYVTHLWSGDLSLIYLPQQQVISSVNTGNSMTPALDIDITRGLAYLPQTHSNPANPAPTYDTIFAPIVNVFQLSGLEMVPSAQIAIDTAVRPVNMPFGVQVDPFRRRVYVANAGSDTVSVINIEGERAEANIEVGKNPRSLLLNADNTNLFVHNAIDGTVTVLDTSTFATMDTIPVTTELTIPVDVLIGSELFHSAADARLATDTWVSCANCHLDGMTDGNTWAAIANGPRNTPVLFGLSETAPYNWTGSWDEIADVELKIRQLQAGTGLIDNADLNDPLGDPHGGLSLDLDALALYVESIAAPTSPVDADLSTLVRGRAVFEEQSCNDCHALPAGTDNMAYDVGTGGEFDTPTIHWLWLSAPYFHDGRAGTLREVFTLPGAHQLQMDVPADDIEALVAYLLTLPSDESFTD